MSPSFEAASIKELPVDLSLGHQTVMDVLSNNDENATVEMWYRLLNCGFRVAISAGTDSVALLLRRAVLLWATSSNGEVCLEEEIPTSMSLICTLRR
jgi:hypothetical protein